MLKHRPEENSVNTLLMSGRVVSNIYSSKVIKKVEGKTKTVSVVKFVLLLSGEKNMPFLISCENSNSIYKIKKYVTKGCRLLFQGYLRSTKRTKSYMKKYFVERNSIEIVLDEIVNIFDTEKEKSDKDKLLVEQGKYIALSDSDKIPSLDKFDSYYIQKEKE